MDDIRYADSGVAAEDEGQPARLEISHEGGFTGQELALGLGQLLMVRGSAHRE